MNKKLFKPKNSQIESFEIITLHTNGMRYSADVEIVMKSDIAEVSQYQIRYSYFTYGPLESGNHIVIIKLKACLAVLFLCFRIFHIIPD